MVTDDRIAPTLAQPVTNVNLPTAVGFPHAPS